MTQITHPAVTKYDLALLFTLIVLIDDRMGDLETENQRLIALATAFHQARERYDTAYKQSSKSFLTEQIDKLDTVRDKLTKVIEWVARYWTELPDDEDAIRGRRVYQPFKDFEYRRDEALMAQNGKWQNIAQVLAQEPQATDCQTMGLTALVTKANQTTQQIASLMAQRQQDMASYQVGEMKAARLNAEACMDELIQYLNALLVVSPDAALEETAQYIQQDFNKVEAQYQQSRKHGKKEDPQPDGGKDDGEGGDVTPVTPEA